jgi:hypothetical protein
LGASQFIPFEKVDSMTRQLGDDGIPEARGP